MNFEKLKEGIKNEFEKEHGEFELLLDENETSSVELYFDVNDKEYVLTVNGYLYQKGYNNGGGDYQPSIYKYKPCLLISNKKEVELKDEQWKEIDKLFTQTQK